MLRTLRDILLTLGFATAIGLPIADEAFGLDPTPDLDEKRELAPEPEFGWADLETYPERYERYLDDHFGFRRLLVRTNAIGKLVALGESTSPKVAVGRDGWLFLADERVLDDHRGDVTLDADKLRRWRRGLEARDAWFAERGIDYCLAVAPNKASVYPERLPEEFANTGAPTRFQQIVAHLAARRASFEIVSLLDPILAAKERGLVYFRTDTHWTSRGGYSGYAAILDRLRAEDRSIPAPLPLESFGHNPVTLTCDLAKMLGLNEWLTEDTEVMFVLPDPGRPALQLSARALPAAPGQALVIDNPGATRHALILRDSFTTTIAEMLAMHFAKCTLVETNSSVFGPIRSIVEAVEPDVVLEIRVERNMAYVPQLDAELRAVLDRRK